MFEMIGMLVGLVVLGGLSFLLGLLIAVAAWLLFWGRPRPKRLILTAACVPPISLGYVIACAIIFAIFVPNQPDQFFGDFSEPLPNGYVLTGLGKMPEYAYFDSESPGRNQPALLGRVKSLEQDGDIVYGAYSHPEYGSSEFFAPKDINYFEFDTHSRQVRSFKTMEELNVAAGHPVHLVDSQFFRSQIPSRVYLRKVENAIYALPPVAWLLLCLYRLVRFRIRGEEETKTRPEWPAGGLGLST